MIQEPTYWQEAKIIFRAHVNRRRAPCPGCGGAGAFALPVFVAVSRPPVLFRGPCRVCQGTGFFKGEGDGE